MAQCYNLVSLLFMVVTMFFAIWTVAARPTRVLKDGDLVSITCNRTLYVETCVSSLRSDPRSQKSNIEGLAGIALDLSIAHATETICHINKLVTNFNSTAVHKPFVSSCLNDCLDEYSEALENLQDSKKGLEVKLYDTVNQLVTTAMTDSDTCQDGFNEIPAYKYPLTERNQYFSKLCSNVLAITNLIVV